jgi:hypothetical protein
MARDIQSVSPRTPFLPNIHELSPKFVNIGHLRNPITVCSWNDKPVGEAEVILERYGVFKSQAFIDPLGPIGLESHTVAYGWDHIPTHSIVMRCPHDVFVDRNYWVYRKTRFGAQWFRVLRIEDIGERQRMLWMLCALVQSLDVRLDPVVQELPVNQDVPTDVSDHFL